MALDLSSLSAYVQEQRVPLIHEAALKSKTAQMLSWQPDVKTKAKINLLNTNVIFQDGDNCGWSDSGSAALSQREIETGVIKINMGFCERSMINYWTQYQVRANVNTDALPFEEDFINGVVAKIDENVEKAIWQGNSGSADPNLNKFNGFLTILGNEASVITGSYDTGSVYNSVQTAYNALPQDAFDRGDVVIFLGEDDYRSYVQELVTKNLYHFDPQMGAEGEYIVPGTVTRVVGVGGLNGTSKIVGGSLRNMFYGFDEEGSEHDFKFWFSEDADEYRLKAVFNAGVQVAYPSEMVLIS